MTLADLLARGVRDPDTGCLIWTGSTDRGYGTVHVRQLGKKRKFRAHRMVLELVVGPLRDDQLACHRCDRHPCIEPTHLFAGTPKDNVQDMISKRRHPHGETKWCARLTDEKVRLARVLYTEGKTTREIAMLIDASQPATWKAIRGKNWSHIPGAVAARRRTA